MYDIRFYFQIGVVLVYLPLSPLFVSIDLVCSVENHKNAPLLKFGTFPVGMMSFKSAKCYFKSGRYSQKLLGIHVHGSIGKLQDS